MLRILNEEDGYEIKERELMSIAEMFTNHLGAWTRFKGRDLNSHATLGPSYARMYKVFEPLRETLDGPMSPSQVAEVLKARKHPG